MVRKNCDDSNSNDCVFDCMESLVVTAEIVGCSDTIGYYTVGVQCTVYGVRSMVCNL